MKHQSNRTYYSVKEDDVHIGTITEGKFFRKRLKELLKFEWGDGAIDIDRIYDAEYRKEASELDRRDMSKNEGFEIKGAINNFEFIIRLKKEYIF